MTAVLLETSRLRLRPFAMTDLEFLHRLWIEPRMRKYLWDDKTISLETAAEIIGDSIASFGSNGYGFWTINLKNAPGLIGFSGLRQFESELSDRPEVEILYGLSPEYWGRGIAGEAARAVLRFGFEEIGLEKIFAGADPPNYASFRVMEKTGMQRTKLIEINNLPALYYSLARSDFEPSNPLPRGKTHSIGPVPKK